MTLMSIPERPLPKSQPNRNSSKNHLKSPSLPLPPSPPVPPGAGPGLDEEDEDGLYSYSFPKSHQGNSDPLAHSCSASARLCAGLTSPISPLSPLTPKYGSFISRDSSLTGINEFASSLGTSYIDSVLIDCYTGQQTPPNLASGSTAMPLPTGESPPSEKVGNPPAGQTEADGGSHPGEEAQEAEGPQTKGDAQTQGAPADTAGSQSGGGLHRGSSAGILKRPQSLALMEEPTATQIVGLENGRRRTVTFSQQVRNSFAGCLSDSYHCVLILNYMFLLFSGSGGKYFAKRSAIRERSKWKCGDRRIPDVHEAAVYSHLQNASLSEELMH